MEDSSEVQATSQRKPLRPYRSVSEMRRRADSTADVAVEDILLEAYVEPPPPTKRSPQSREKEQPKPEPFRVSFPSIPPPRPSEAARVDALLARHVEIPREVPPQAGRPREAPSWEVEVPSIAPVALATHSTTAHAPVFPLAPPPMLVAPPQAKSSSGGAIVAALALVLVAGVTGAGVALATHPAWMAKAKTLLPHEKSEVRPVGDREARRAEGAADGPRGRESTPVAAAPPPQLQPPSTVVTAPPPPPAPAPTIDPSTTLVTFPPYAEGHRIFFDGKLVPYDGSPVALKCGHHVLRIGLAGRVRNVSFACGEATTLR